MDGMNKIVYQRFKLHNYIKLIKLEMGSYFMNFGSCTVCGSKHQGGI